MVHARGDDMFSPQMTVFVIATSVFYVTLWLWLLIVDKSTAAYRGRDDPLES